MIYQIYSVRDEKKKEYSSLLVYENAEVAKRDFETNFLNQYLVKCNPQDFSLWTLGSYCTEEGLNSIEPVCIYDFEMIKEFYKKGE